MTLGQNLKKYREEKGIKKVELERHLNKSKGVVTKWENGESRPDADTIAEICRFLDITPNILLEWNAEDKPQIIAASGGNMVSENTMSERDKDLMQTKQRLVNTIYAANLDKRQMEELIIMVNAFEKL